MNSFLRRITRSPLSILFLLAGIKLLIPLLTHPDFGFHRDEFLYMAMADHPAWGYLEVPPFIAFISGITRLLLGDSLYAMRFLPALSGAVTLLLTGLITRELGGGRFAQILSAVAYLTSLVYLRMNLLLQPVTFDLMFFVLAIYLFIRILKTGLPRYWILLGLVTGIGLLNKYTMLLFGFGVFVALLLTPHRKLFLSRWPYIAASIAVVIWLPNLVWQTQQGWPFFEHMKVLAQNQLSNVNPFLFLLAQLLMNFYAAPVWIVGLYSLFFGSLAINFRSLGWIYVSILLVLLFLSGKDYYLAPAYPMMFAAGAKVIENYIRRHSRVWLKPAIFAVIILGNLTLLPVGIPVFPVNGMIEYFKFGSTYLGIEPALRWETGQIHELPQDFADMLGWEAMAAAAAQVYHNIPDSLREKYTIFGNNYGEAGAIYYYSRKYHLPEPISNSSSFWLWGYGNRQSNHLITVGSDSKDVEAYFEEVAEGATFIYPHARESGIKILKAKGLKIPVEKLWEILKQYRW